MLVLSLSNRLYSHLSSSKFIELCVADSLAVTIEYSSKLD
jgi:hypothetical protein